MASTPPFTAFAVKGYPLNIKLELGHLCWHYISYKSGMLIPRRGNNLINCIELRYFLGLLIGRLLSFVLFHGFC